MYTLPVGELVNSNFNVVFINALKQFWRTNKFFQCINAPKKQNLLLLLSGCKITYTDKDGNVVTANSGDVVYCPIGGEYKAEMSDFEDDASHTVGINFMLYDEAGEGVTLSEGVEVFRADDKKVLSMLFHQLINHDPAIHFTQNRILLMEIISALASGSASRAHNKDIDRAIKYLADHVTENPTVSELAALAHVSAVYFRRQFKLQTGMTPIEYRTHLRISKARSYLAYGDVCVQEISNTLGYSTVSHFIKEFKKYNGCSPLKYRKLESLAK